MTTHLKHSQSSLSQVRSELTQNLKFHLDQLTPNHSVAESYDYAVFPPGKLLRPLLVKAIWSDLGENHFFAPWGQSSPHSCLASAIELHHAYTLVHDDLPCMDDDEMRRGKPTTHKKYGEWQAILVGDGLLNASYLMLSYLPPNALSAVLRLFGSSLGPKGLIQGQVLDMSTQENKKMVFKDIIEIHRLKTAKLMQVAIVGSYLLLPPTLRKVVPTTKLRLLANHIGIHFQLLDDLQDLVTQKDGHEKEINPFVTYPKESCKQLIHSLTLAEQLIDELKLDHLRLTLSEYWAQNLKWVQENDKVLKKALPKEILLNPLLTNSLNGILHR